MRRTPRKVIDLSGKKPLQILVIPLVVVVVIPVLIVFKIVDLILGWPFRIVARRKLKKEIENELIPNKKYIYIRYSDEDSMAELLDVIIQKHPEIVATRFNSDDDEWETNWKGISRKLESALITQVFPDYDDELITFTYLNYNTHQFDYEFVVKEMDGKSFITNIKEQELGIDELEVEIQKYISAALKTWRED